MISPEELERYLERVRSNPDEEPEFFRQLLEARVYAHRPISDDHPRLRLIQFLHPDGFTAVPFFTSLEKASVPAGVSARIVACTGRELLAITRGATLMLNPNDGGCVLYPEEVDALLEGRPLCRIDQTTENNAQAIVPNPTFQPESHLCSILRELFGGMAWVEAAHILETCLPRNPTERSLLVAIATPMAQAERTARATVAALHNRARLGEYPIDLTTFDPTVGTPEYLRLPGVQRFYTAKH